MYHFNIKQSGLANLAPFLGILTAIFATGFLSDVFEMRSIRIAARDGRDIVPEKRLILLLIPGLLGVMGTALFGGCTQQHCHWLGPLAGAFGCKFLAHLSSYAPSARISALTLWAYKVFSVS